MDGILVSYHNTLEMFGFQYFTLKQLRTALFGSEAIGERAFVWSLQILDHVLEKITAELPDRNVKIMFASPMYGVSFFFLTLLGHISFSFYNETL